MEVRRVSSVEIGAEIAMRYKEKKTVINAIASHMADVEGKLLLFQS